jgi:hypothetical protein
VCLVMMGRLILARRLSFSRSKIEASFAVHTKAVCWGLHIAPSITYMTCSHRTSVALHHSILRIGGPAADVLTFSLSHLVCCVESASTYELKAIIESPKPLTPTRCLVSELKTALVDRKLSFVIYAASRLPSLTSFCMGVSNRVRRSESRVESTHQSTHGAVKSMPMVPPELGVGTLEGRVTVRLRLLNTISPHH